MKELLILEIPKPKDEGSIQKPTKDIPTGKADIVLDENIVTSSSSPFHIQQALDQLDQHQHSKK